MSANAGTGVLDPCVCRVSVRKVPSIMFCYRGVYFCKHIFIAESKKLTET